MVSTKLVHVGVEWRSFATNAVPGPWVDPRRAENGEHSNSMSLSSATSKPCLPSAYMPSGICIMYSTSVPR